MSLKREVERKRRRILFSQLLAAFLWIYSAATFALNPRTAVSQFGADAWRTKEGLPELAVQTLLEADDGYLWVGTQEGLARFDGLNFEVFNRANSSAFSSDFITALAQDRDHSLWIGTRNGVVVRNAGKYFRSLDSHDDNAVTDVAAILSDRDGTIWIGGVGGLEHIVDGHVTHVMSSAKNAPHDVTRLVVDAEGSIWALASGSLYRVKSGHIENFGAKLGEDGLQIRSLYTSKNGQLFVLADRNVVLRRVGEGFERWPVSGLSETAEILAAKQDRDGSFWLSTRDEGLLRIKNEHYPDAAVDRGLEGIEVQTFLEDSRGNLWMGTLGNGLMRLRDSPFTVYGTDQGLAAPLPLSVLDDTDGDIWVGTFRGLTKFGADNTATFTTKNGLSNNFVTSLARSAKGGIWVGSVGNELVRLTHGKVDQRIRLDTPLPVGRVDAVLEDRQGRLWSGTRDSGLALTEGGETTYFTIDQGLPDNSITALAEDEIGNVWIGTEGGVAEVRADSLERQTRLVSFPSQIHVLSLCIRRDGVLWIGTRSDGLYKLKDAVYSSFSIDPRLTRTSINSVVTDFDDNLWVGTNHGIFKLSNDSLDGKSGADESQPTVIRFGEDDGLTTAETTTGGQPSAWRDAKGNLWFVTTEGAAKVDPRNVSVDNRELQTEIRSVTVDGHAVAAKDGLLDLPSGSSHLEIRFSAPDLSAAKTVIFRHRLSGADKDWVANENNRVAIYSIIPTGSHKFEVEAGHENLPWPSRPASLTVSMRPAFYQTPQFVVAVVALLALIAGVLHHLRIKWISLRHAVSEERQKMAGEIHDGLAQGFSAISVQIQAALAQIKTDPTVAVGHLEVANEVSRLSLSDARESVWNLQSPLSSRDDLVAAVRAACEPIVYGTGVKLYVASEGTLRRLNPVVQNNLIRISQESVANAIRHGNACEVRISVVFSFSEVVFAVIDDGRGIEVKVSDGEPNRGFGLKNIRHRVDDMHGKLELKSAIGVGTSITIRIPRFPFSMRTGRPNTNTLQRKQ